MQAHGHFQTCIPAKQACFAGLFSQLSEKQWAQKVEGYMRGLPKPGSMSEAASILIQLKQWCEKKWVSKTHFQAVTVRSWIMQPNPWMHRPTANNSMMEERRISRNHNLRGKRQQASRA
jgi:hypothetical protein